MAREASHNEVRILVVEDDWFAMNACIKILDRMGYQNIQTAGDGKDALQIIADQSEAFDLIILDLNLPHMNGLQFIQHLPGLGYAGTLIILSGEDERLLEATFDLALQSGIHILDAIAKPVDAGYFEQLLAKVTRDRNP